MIFILRDLFYGAAILAGMGLVYTSLGTLNGRLSGGFTPHNLPWAICVAVFAVAALGGVAVKGVLLVRRRHAKPYRAHVSGKGWARDPD